MLKMSSQLEQVVAAYKTVSKIPYIVGGKLSNGGKSITSKWAVRNLDKGKPTVYRYNYQLDDCLNVVSESEFGADVGTEIMSSISPRESFRAVIREEKDGKDKKHYLEVWSRSILAHCVDLTALELHGDIYAGWEFGCLDWSQDESSIVYIAEKKLKKSEPFIKRSGKPKQDGSGEEVPLKGEEYVYKPEWGEQLVGKHLSVIVVCEIESETFTVLEGLPDSWCPGQVRFLPDGQSVVGVAWETEPNRLGLIYCTNRPSYVFELTLNGQMKTLSTAGVAVRSPRVSPSGDVAWLQRTSGGTHHACHTLMLQCSQTKQIKTLVDIVQTERPTVNGPPFYGIYSQGLPGRCWVSARRMVFSTPQKLAVKAYIVDMDSGSIADISHKAFNGSTSILDVKEDIVLAICSNMTTPAQLFVARIPPPGSEGDIAWVRVSAPTAVPESVASATCMGLEIKNPDTDDPVRSFTALYFAPQRAEKLPLIVWPHGGPHINFVNSFSMEAAFFNLLGFACLQINYRGSTGTGQASVDFLPKRVGDTDVTDCKLATDEAIRLFPIDENQLVLFGGSHGGFLVTYLSGKYPDMYKAVVTRNPVTDIASMSNSTDIPDWCSVEAGFPFKEGGPFSDEELLAMRRCSPLVHVHNVKAATLLLLGNGDLRVPKFQGLQWARALKANGVPVRVQMYEDNHSLCSMRHEIDHLINSGLWYLEHLQKS